MIGYVFYDELYGDIRGVSLKLVEDLSHHKVLEVPREEALAFLTGEKQADEWTVGHGPALVKLSAFRVELTDQGWAEITEDPESPVTITVKMAKSAPFAEVSVATNSPHLKVQGPEDILFVFTLPGQPEAIVGHLRCSLAELMDKKTAMAKLEHVVPEEVEVWTRRWSPISYRVERPEIVRPRLPMPKAPVILMQHVRPGKPTGPSLVVRRFPETVEFELLDGGGPYYDRGLESFLAAFCRPGDPDAVLKTQAIDVSTLDNQIILEVDAPEEDFDLYIELMYADTVLVDMRA